MRLRWLGLAVLAFAVGCGHDEVVHVGAKGEQGEYKRDIERAKDVANTADQKLKDGERDVYGG